MRVLRIVAIVLLAILGTAFFAASTSRSAAAQVAPALSHQPPAFLIGHSSSLNWAGYSSYAGNGTFTDAKGSWTQPTATCSSKTTYSSFWVGLDGYNSSSV